MAVRVAAEPTSALTLGLAVAVAVPTAWAMSPPASPVPEKSAVVVAWELTAIEPAVIVPLASASIRPLAVAEPLAVPIATKPPAAP